jgi:hypothetical protein
MNPIEALRAFAYCRIEMVLQSDSSSGVEGAMSVEWRIPLITIVETTKVFARTDSLVRSVGYRSVMF